MQIKLSLGVKSDLKKIKQKDLKLAGRIEKQLTLFAQYPKHPSLRTHKLSGKVENRWSISITKSIRMAYLVIQAENDRDPYAYFVAIGTHDQVYRDKK
ncbi:hypothetical protein HYU95_05540 [Candidatus Daviesbacteria bacterium]|nr:hypothetical protein [Candidatus Daviesbacteria bacterium]